jgi:restriction system protein
VGNSAVQEASAGAVYWNGTHAVVVTNAEFTKAAKQLASSTNVTLLHYSRLALLKEELGD